MIILYITAPSLKEAKNISISLLEKKLIACANISKTESLYSWNGKKAGGKEFVIYAKTTAKAAKKAVKFVEQIHPYGVPCILTISVKANPAYERWVKAQTKNY